jgi:uncharacterized protein YabN with tetrapyrrole methylase and pyrophosphatase domain
MIDQLLEKQKEFQKLCKIDLEVEPYHLSEGYLFKAIEEITELRKTFPSSFNKYEKVEKIVNRQRTLEEFCDVILFLMNFALVWKFTQEEVLEALKYVQRNNFHKLQKKESK